MLIALLIQFFFLRKNYAVLNTNSQTLPPSFFFFFFNKTFQLACAFFFFFLFLNSVDVNSDSFRKKRRVRLWEKWTCKNIILTTKLIFNSLPTLSSDLNSSTGCSLTRWSTVSLQAESFTFMNIPALFMTCVSVFWYVGWC